MTNMKDTLWLLCFLPLLYGLVLSQDTAAPRCEDEWEDSVKTPKENWSYFCKSTARRECVVDSDNIRRCEGQCIDGFVFHGQTCTAENCKNVRVDGKTWDAHCDERAAVCEPVENKSPQCRCPQGWKFLNDDPKEKCIPQECDDIRGGSDTWDIFCRRDPLMKSCYSTKEQAPTCVESRCTDPVSKENPISWEAFCTKDDYKNCTVDISRGAKCECKTGFREVDGKCILPKKCDDKLSDEQTWADLCRERGALCSELGNKPECRCPEGYKFESNDPGAKCILQVCGDIRSRSETWNDFCKKDPSEKKKCYSFPGQKPTCVENLCEDIVSENNTQSWKSFCEVTDNMECVVEISKGAKCDCKTGFKLKDKKCILMEEKTEKYETVYTSQNLVTPGQERIVLYIGNTAIHGLLSTK